MFNYYLEKMKIDKKILSIYSEGSSNKFIAGFIQAQNENCYIYTSITPEGKYDGVCLKKNEIIKIEYDGLYEKKLEQLMVQDDFKQEQLDIKFDDNSNLIEQLLIYIKNSNRILSIELLDSGYDDIIGFVKNIDGEYCLFSSVNEYGIIDSNVVIRKDDITRISFDSAAEIQIETLFSKN